MLKHGLLLLLILFLPLSVSAKLYKVIDEDGHVTFTDIPPDIETKEHKLGRITTVDNPEFNKKKLEMSIPFTNENGSMIVQGSVNGIAMAFVVDTGATLLAIPPSIAEQAGLYDIPATKVDIQTANGRIQTSKITIKKLSVANINRENVTATITSVSEDKPNLGLLGMSFFKQYKMTIHQDKKEIQLEQK